MAIIEPEQQYTVSPIRPSEAKAKRVKAIPPQVIAIVNNLIVANLKQLSDKRVEAKVTQRDIVNGIASDETLKDILLLQLEENLRGASATDGWLESTALQLGWLDVEDAFELAGWTVKYDRPSIGDSYPAYFKFTSKE